MPWEHNYYLNRYNNCSIDIDAEKLLGDICDTPDSLNAQQTLSSAPFDYFHYFNTDRAQHVINCHEHVDPGQFRRVSIELLSINRT